MRKIAFLLALAGIVLASDGCKKGDEDPLLSLRSRKARLTGTWLLDSSRIVYYYYDSDEKVLRIPPAPEFDFKGTLDSVVTVVNDNLAVDYSSDGDKDTSLYAYTIEFNGDGTCKLETYRANLEKTSERWTTQYGIWYFLDGDDQLDVKDKERVVVQITKEVYKRVYNQESGTNIYLDSVLYDGTTAGSFQVLQLKELRNKEIKIHVDNKVLYDDGSYEQTVGDMVFHQPED